MLAAQAALAPAPWPGVTTHLAAELARDAALVWRSDAEAPLLALLRRGSGRTAALAFAPGAEAPGWTEARAARLLAPVASWLAAGRARAALAVELEGQRLVLQGAELAQRAARIDARVRPAQSDGADRGRVAFEPDLGPGGDLATRVAAWPADLDLEPGAYAVELELDPARTLALAVARTGETAWPRSFWSVPRRTAEAGADPAAFPAGDPRAFAAFGVAVLLLAAAGFLGLGAGRPVAGRGPS
ncbi:MAG: hypothetical protein IPJ77_15590 [Planctomycetes bacterium]|nr:hypothetical protein [Planctomycetota bacterium]